MDWKFFTDEVTIYRFKNIEDYNNAIDNPTADGDRYHTNYGYYDLYGIYKDEEYGINKIEVAVSPYYKETEISFILNDLKLKFNKEFYLKSEENK